MSAYLAEHLPHLQSLHTQLALDSTALQADQDRIETAIKAAVEALLREREQQVDEYKDVISGQKRRLGCLARAVGDKGRNVVQESRRESVENETLPKQLERLVKQSEELEKVYDERLKHIEKQQSYLNQLAVLLGAPFEPAKPLEPIASSSSLTAAPGLARIVSGTAAGARLSSGRGGDVAGGSTSKEDKEALFDVSEAITGQLDLSVSAALEERASRLVELESSMHDLRTLHTELALPPIPISHPHHFPLHMLPNGSTEEIPGAHLGYEKLLSKVITEKVKVTMSIGEEGEEVEVESDLEAMQGVEPEVGLIRWVEAVRDLWEQEQSNRAAKIQELYDQLEPLWQRLQLDQDQIDLFIQMNIGCSEAAIKAYEAELERCYELRRSSLSSFIVAVRNEIEVLWTELMLSDEEKSDFGAYINDDYSEEILAEHEAYIEQLRAEIESKSNLLPKVREWHALVIEEEELERAQTDPDRYKRRGGAMLREEKLRKRVTMLKPKVEQDLLNLLPVWEEANGRPFMVQGERVVDKIHDALEAKELAKEAKKRIRMGLAPTAPPKPLGPAKTVRPTPTTGRSVSSSMSTISRKREAPTPTPMAFGMNKRTKLAPPSSISSRTTTSNLNSNSTRLFSGSRAPSSVISQNGSSARMGTMKFRDQSSSPTIVPCGLPRFTGCSKQPQPQPQPPTRIPLPSFSITPTPATASIVTTTTIKLPPLHQLAKANGRRPRRESFRPRQSIMIMSGLGMGGVVDLQEELEEMMEEEGDVFE